MQHQSETDRGRNARRHRSPQDRIRICRAIHELIALESVEPAAHRRNVLLRLSIGLPPVPRRTINLEAAQ
jgi:PIN domain nuclease of toxin-antitoxin system